MRPHRLRLSAFGPFAGTVEVDLDALAAGGLFLLHGDTGAGKTTLLDGLGYALYGRVPGERARARRLRSDHAAEDIRTEVQLELTVASRRLRITRRPEQPRPKLRGGGSTSEPAKVLLEEHGPGGWRSVSTRAGEADAEIADAMGMSAEQFYQVVLLPQGQFARFLAAGSEERGKLLERLFATDRFRSVEVWLAEQRRAGAAAVQAAAERAGRLVARAAQAAGVPDPREAEERDSGSAAGSQGFGGSPAVRPAPRGWVEALLAEAAVAHAAADTAVQRTQAALALAHAAEAAARRQSERERRRRAAEQQVELLAGREPEISARARELEAAERAAVAAPALQEAARTATLLERARAAEDRSRRAAAAAGATGDGTGAGHLCGTEPAAVLRAAQERLRERYGRLEGLRDLAEQAGGERATAAEAQRQVQSLERQLRAEEAGLAALGGRHLELEGQLARAQDAGARLPDAERAADRLGTAAADAAAALTARREQHRLQLALTAARERSLLLRERASTLRENRIEGMIGELSAALEDDTPCPVCGSLQHPEPSGLRPGSVSREEEKEAVRAADAVGVIVVELTGALAAVTSTRDALTARLAAADCGAGDPVELGARAAAALMAVTELRATHHRRAELQRDLARVQREQRDAAERRAAAAAHRAAEQDKGAAAAARAGTVEEALHSQLDGAADLAAALASAADAASLLGAAAEAVATRERLEQEVGRTAGEAADAARRAGFAGPADSAVAARPADWCMRIRADLAAHREEVAAVRLLLADPELAPTGEPAADLGAVAAVLAEAQEEHAGELARCSVAAGRLAELERLVPEVVAALAGLEPLQARAAEVRGLADLAAGGGANVLRMTLSAYVLAARLEEVAAAATERLLPMTQGRYALVHTDGGTRAGRSGLGLLARDAWTGQDRDTCTLSGGETFLASLALALGLADVVTAEAGGAPIEALFVDEGFGSLDEETLEEAMDVLDGLRSGGRLVGVVSHVAELRRRIPTQVHVMKGRAGSSLAVVAG